MAKVKTHLKQRTKKQSKIKTTAQDIKLESALVPEDEQPYKVPNNWVWVRFKAVLDYEQPTDYIVKSTEYDDNLGTPVLTAGKSFILGYTDEKFGIFKKTPVIIFDDFTTDIKYVNFPFKVKSSAMKILFPVTNTKIEFIYFFMQTVDCDHSNHQRFWISKYSLLPFPLPPLEEQQRIEKIINKLFIKLDRAKELAQSALDSFETRKAVILHKAFSGELTAKWRRENGVKLESWEKKSLAELSELITKGASPKWQGINYTNDIKQTLFITSENVREGFIDLDKEKYLENRINIIQKRSILKSGDLLLNIVGASIGRAAIYNIKKIANINQAVCLIRIKKNLNAIFLCNFLNSPVAMQYYNANKVDVARANLSLEDVGNISLLLPSLPEQKEIVRILDCLFEKEKRARELCGVIEKIDLMKKAILARAFRGELGTNVAGEERVRV